MKNNLKAPQGRSKKVRRLDNDTPFAIREAFNQLRTNLMYTSNDQEGCPAYGITSAEISVGKSTVSANIAISFSQLGKKVLVVDADMRRPAQHRIFGYNKKQAGLSELLTGIETDDKKVLSNPADNLYLITSGCIPPNPSELLLSKRFGEFVSKWKQEYDIIFIDLPPVGVVTDPIIVAKNINGYVFVTLANFSDAIRVNRAIEAIENVGGKITGIVVNGNSRKGAAYSSKRNHYKYSYTDNSDD